MADDVGFEVAAEDGVPDDMAVHVEQPSEFVRIIVIVMKELFRGFIQPVSRNHRAPLCLKAGNPFP
jgi:hypothetical protein